MPADAPVHWHGYGWVGSATEYAQESRRRPGRHPGDETTARFLESGMPPMMTGWWLLRTRQTRPELTWTDPGPAADWLAARYKEHPPAGPVPEGLTPELRATAAVDSLYRGVDVTFAHYTGGGARSVASYSVVCCPNRHHPRIPCPLPPS